MLFLFVERDPFLGRELLLEWFHDLLVGVPILHNELSVVNFTLLLLLTLLYLLTGVSVLLPDGLH